MTRLSMKAVVVGNLFDILISLVASVFLVAYAHSEVHASTMTLAQKREATVQFLYRPSVHIFSICSGLIVSAVAGFLSGKIAHRNELLNGMLASVLCACLGVAVIVHGKSHDPLWLQLMLLVTAPVFATGGGFVAEKSRS